MMSIKLKLTPEQPAEKMELFREFFGKDLQNLHNACCFYILEMCVQWTRVDTGRLRSGWIPYMVAHNHNYERSMGPVRDAKDGAIQEGLDAGRYQEGYLSLYVENGVNYAPYVDALTGVRSNLKTHEERAGFGGMFDMSGQHSFKSAPLPTFQACQSLFAEQYAVRMEQMLKNCDAQLEHIMKGGSPEDLDQPIDLGAPDLN